MDYYGFNSPCISLENVVKFHQPVFQIGKVRARFELYAILSNMNLS